MRRMHRRTIDRHRTPEKRNHRAAENVVAVARHHVAGIGHIDVLRMRTQGKKVLGTGFAEHVGQTTAHQQGRQREMARAILQALLAPLQVARAGPKKRVPVPVVFAVGAQAHVLRQAIEVLGPHTLRLVVADGLGHFFQRAETFGLLGHKGLDLGYALGLDARCNVHHDQGAGIDVVLTRRDQAGTAPHGRADQHRARLAQLRNDTFQVPHHHVLRIQTVGRPLGVAMAARVERNGVITGGAQQLAGAFPGMAGLATAMLQQHQRAVRLAPCVPRDAYATKAAPPVHRLGGSWKSAACCHGAVPLCVMGSPRLPAIILQTGSEVAGQCAKPCWTRAGGGLPESRPSAIVVTRGKNRALVFATFPEHAGLWPCCRRPPRCRH